MQTAVCLENAPYHVRGLAASGEGRGWLVMVNTPQEELLPQGPRAGDPPGGSCRPVDITLCSGPWQTGGPRGGVYSSRLPSSQHVQGSQGERLDSKRLLRCQWARETPRASGSGALRSGLRGQARARWEGPVCPCWGGAPYLGTAAWPAGTLNLCGMGRQRAGGWVASSTCREKG